MVIDATPSESLVQAIDLAGSQSAFARLCGVSQTAVWKWLQSGKRLPAEHVLKVEAETGVSRHRLRPDIYPPETASILVDDCSGITLARPNVECDRRTLSQRSAAA